MLRIVKCTRAKFVAAAAHGCCRGNEDVAGDSTCLVTIASTVVVASVVDRGGGYFGPNRNEMEMGDREV